MASAFTAPSWEGSLPSARPHRLRAATILALVIVGLSIFDAAATWFAMRVHAVGEGSPIVRPWIEIFGLEPGLILRVLVGGILPAALWLNVYRVSGRALVLLKGGAGFLGLLAAYHIVVGLFLTYPAVIAVS